MIITIDGPAGSGKSTTARAVAERLGFRHLDSGAFYRALTWAALVAGVPEQDWAGLTRARLDAFDLAAEPEGRGFVLSVGGRRLGAELRTPEVTSRVSVMARVPAVRRWLLGRLRELARSQDVVADGRDQGSVVFPDAELKVFLVAAPEERARRRLREQGETAPHPLRLEEERARLLARDRLDSERALAPLTRPADAVVVDTTGLRFEDQVEAIVRLARDRRGRGSAHPAEG